MGFKYKKKLRLLYCFVGIILIGLNYACSPANVLATGGSTALVVAEDERSFGTVVDDATIKVNISAKLLNAGNNLFVDVNITVLEGRVLLTGLVDNQELRIEAVSGQGPKLSTTASNSNITIAPHGTGFLDVAGGLVVSETDTISGSGSGTDAVSLSTVMTFLDTSSGTSQLTMGAGTVGQIKIITKLINSSFPDYESVIPTTNDQIMEVDCKSFSESIDRVSTISNEKFRTVKFDVSNNVCVVSSFGTEKSIGTENVKVGYSGPAFSINFNSRYVLDVLNIIKEGKVKFFFSKDTAPTILETSSIKNSLFLIMQMRA